MNHSLRSAVSLAGAHSFSRLRRRAFRAVVGLIAFSSCAIWWTPAGASEAQKYAVDQISRSYEISVTNPIYQRDFPAVLLVQNAKLTTINPDGSGIAAPKGKIYLVLQASSGPVQLPLANPNAGSFFSNMAPLPATALRYVTASGHSYSVTRANPINQTYNGNTNDDGLFDATYYFTVPLSNRSGTLVISPFRTVGVEYEGFVGISTSQLIVGGPTSIALKFPESLTVVSNTRAKAPIRASDNGTTFARTWNFFATLFAVLLAGVIIVRNRRKKKAAD